MGQWSAETLDPGSSLGQTSVALPFGGKLHVFYDPLVGLRHASWDGAAWTFELLDPGSTMLNDSIAAAQFGTQLHTFSRFLKPGQPMGLRHGWFDGSWHFETLDDHNSDGRVSTAAAYGPHLHVFTHAPPAVLRHGWWSGTTWSFQVEDSPESLGASLSSSVYGGQLHVFGKGLSATDALRHGWSGGGPWVFETLDPGPSKGHNTAAAVYRDQLHVVNGDVAASVNDMRHGWFDGSTWRGFSDLPVTISQGSPLIAYEDVLHLFARDRMSGSLRHAEWKGSSWSSFDTVDAGASQGFFVSTAVYDGILHVFNAGYSSSAGLVFRHLRYDSSWDHIGHANNVVAMTALNNKLFAATSDNVLWARDPVLSDVAWQPIGHANDVVAMAALDSKLFAATSDNRLWVRDL